MATRPGLPALVVVLAAMAAVPAASLAESEPPDALEQPVEAAQPAGPERNAEPDQPAETQAPAPEIKGNVFDAGHAYASAGVRGLGAWIDGFFSDERYEAELNESWMRLRLDSFSELYEGTEVDAKVRLYLKLPGTTERLRVEVLSNSDPDDASAAAAGPSDPSPPESTLDTIAAALTYFFRNDEETSVSARVGVAFDGYDPDPFVGLRYRRHVDLSDDLDFRFVQRLRYYVDRGAESRTTFSLDRALPNNLLFRSELDGTWLEEDPDYFYGVNFSLFQPLDEKSAVEYQERNLFRTGPHRLDEVTLLLRYRRQVWRDWLVLEFAPQLAMPRDRDYDPVPGFLFRIEMTFGG